MNISKRWLRMAEVYILFTREKRIRWLPEKKYEVYEYTPELNFSEKAKEEAYLFESSGIGNLEEKIFSDDKSNGYLYGKRMMDITVKMWKEDIPKGLLFLYELYNDKFPHWWLNKIFNRKKAAICFL
jgi:hypothetical protein